MSTTKVYDDTNTGIIGANDYKQKDTHPDVKGRVNVDGLWYWVSGWNKEGSNGREFTSLALTIMTQDDVDKMMAKRAEKNAPQQRNQQRTQPPAAANNPAPQQSIPEGHPAQEPPAGFDEDIPF
jgi:hypothetical protein